MTPPTPAYSTDAHVGELRVDATDELLQFGPVTLWRLSEGKQEMVAGPSAPATILRLRMVDSTTTQTKFLPMLSVLEANVALLPMQKVYRQGENAYLIPVVDQASMYRLELSTEAMSKRQALEELLAYYVIFELDGMRSQAAVVNRSTGEVMGVLDGVQGPTDIMTDTSEKIVPVVLQQVDQTTTSQREIDEPAEHKTHVRAGADKLVSGSEALSKTMVYHAEKLGLNIVKHADGMKGKITPSATPVTVSVHWKKKVKDMRSYTRAIATTSSFLSRMVLATVNQMARMLGKVIAIDPKKDPKMSDARYALAKSLLAAANILDGMEQSVKVVGAQSGKATIELLTHKYGAEVGQVLSDAADAAGDLVVVYFDAKGISRRALIKASAVSVLHVTKENAQR